jgi:pimeloyl-ACP methyl ester carboxylesterase
MFTQSMLTIFLFSARSRFVSVIILTVVLGGLHHRIAFSQSTTANTRLPEVRAGDREPVDVAHAKDDGRAEKQRGLEIVFPLRGNFHARLFSVDSYEVNKHEQTFILVHGFLSKPSAWAEDMGADLRKRFPKANILLLDWTELSSNIDYFGWFNSEGAVASAVITGEKLAWVLQTKLDVRIGTLHLIGHSLGAHICGIAGAEIASATGRSVAQITGLDPAKQMFENQPDRCRVDCSDAKRVVIIHTSKEFGLAIPSGHLDLYFYPNSDESQHGYTDPVTNHNFATKLLTHLIRGAAFVQHGDSSVVEKEVEFDDIFETSGNAEIVADTLSGENSSIMNLLVGSASQPNDPVAGLAIVRTKDQVTASERTPPFHNLR